MQAAPAIKLLTNTQQLLDSYTMSASCPLTYMNCNKWNNKVVMNRVLNSYLPSRESIGPVTFGRYSYPVTIDPDGDFLASCGDFLIWEQIHQELREDLELLSAKHLISKKKNVSTVEVPALLVGRYGYTTWGHWLWEMLPKIVLVEHAFPGAFMYVVPAVTTVPTGARDYTRSVLESLAAYGIFANRLVRLTPQYVYRFSELYDVIDCFQGVLHKDLLHLMRKISMPASRKSPTKVVVMRGNDQTRSMFNGELVQNYLSSRGFVAVDVFRSTFEDQVAAFSRSEYVAGDLGSNLAGLLYSPEGVKLLSFGPSDWDDGYFINIIKGIEGRQADVRGPSTLMHMDNLATSSYVITLPDVEHGLSSLANNVQSDRQPINLGDRIVPRILGAPVVDLHFGAGGNGHAYRRQGWHRPEVQFTWSDGKSATLDLSGIGLQPQDYWIELHGLSIARPPYLVGRPFIVKLNDRVLLTTVICYYLHEFVFVPRDLIVSSASLVVELNHEVCPTPHDIGLGPDDRRLGVGLEQLSIYTCSH